MFNHPSFYDSEISGQVSQNGSPRPSIPVNTRITLTMFARESKPRTFICHYLPPGYFFLWYYPRYSVCWFLRRARCVPVPLGTCANSTIEAETSHWCLAWQQRKGSTPWICLNGKDAPTFSRVRKWLDGLKCLCIEWSNCNSNALYTWKIV